MYPKNINEIIVGLEHSTLREGQHVEFKIYHGAIKVDDLSRSMIGLANSGGGVIVIGVADMTSPRSTINGAVMFRGIPTDTNDSLRKSLPDYLKARVVNVDDWRVELGTCFNMDIAAVFVEQSRHGMAYIYSTSDKANRTYYYRRGSDVINIRNQFRTVYKYMTMDAAITSLENKSWRFWEPRKWADKYETRFYCANYDKLNAESESVQRIYATCVTRNQNSEAAWKVYAGKEGMQAHCIQLELDLVKLLEQLFKSDCRIHERRVEYKDEKYIMGLHESASKHHKEYFDDFNFNLFLNLLALKRDAYTYENEVRFFATSQNAEERSHGRMKPFHRDLEMDWKDVIKRIRVDKNCSDSELVALRYSCWNCGINPVIKGRVLPGGIPASALGMKHVDVVLFNIDDMPGRKSIEIEAV